MAEGRENNYAERDNTRSYGGGEGRSNYRGRDGDKEDGDSKGGFRSGNRKFFKRRDRRRVCFLCKNNINTLDYKDVPLLQRFINERGKILPRRMTGSCSKHQRLITRVVKISRNIALLPFAAE